MFPALYLFAVEYALRGPIVLAAKKVSGGDDSSGGIFDITPLKPVLIDIQKWVLVFFGIVVIASFFAAAIFFFLSAITNSQKYIAMAKTQLKITLIALLLVGAYEAIRIVLTGVAFGV